MFTNLLTSVDARAVAVAVTVNVVCALVGVLLVIRRQSLMGDAIAHAVLPGLAVAFLLSGSLGAGAMLAGAVAAGLMTTFLTETLHRRGGVSADSALGVVYTSLFALGVVMVKRYMKGIHFDVKCVYEGSLLGAALDTTPLLGMEVPRVLISAAIVLVLVLIVTVLLWKELKLCAFDPALASTMGISATVMHYLVMALVAMTAAVSFEAVGAILVVAMMITPAATAQLLSHRLAPITAIAAGLACLWAVLGYAVASRWDVSPAGSMATLAGLGYLVAVIASPQGVVAKLLANARLSLQVRRDDLLSLLYRHEEGSATPTPIAVETALRSIGGGRWAQRGLDRLTGTGLIVATNIGLSLTDSGREAAAKLVRAHRLWEAYLVKEVGIQEDHVHEPAHMVEHYLDPELETQIEESLGDATRDPHGRTIPSAKKD